MQLTDEDITQFQNLYKQCLGEDIPRERAQEEARKLLRLMELVYRPMTKEGQQKLLERDRNRKTKR